MKVNKLPLEKRFQTCPFDSWWISTLVAFLVGWLVC